MLLTVTSGHSKCNSTLSATCVRKGHESFCPIHNARVAQGKDCIKCRNEALAAEKAARAERAKQQEARKRAVEKAADFMSRKGKDRKPRASESDKSSFW